MTHFLQRNTKFTASLIPALSFILFFIPALCHASTGPTYASAPTAANVLVVYNSNITTDSDPTLCGSTQESKCLAQYYATARNIPVSNVVGIAAPTSPTATGTDQEIITDAQYVSQIQTPLENYLNTATSSADGTPLLNKIRFIVLMKGVPLKISDGAGESVDAAIAVLFEGYPDSAYIPNPYWSVDSTFNGTYHFLPNAFSGAASYYPFTPAQDITASLNYLVTRLDGQSVPDVKGMIDRAIAADTSGQKYFVIDDSNPNGYETAAERAKADATLRSFGYKDIYSNTGAIIGSSTIFADVGSTTQPMIGYTSDGDNGTPPIYNVFDTVIPNTNNLYANGAVAQTFESYSGLTVTGDNCNGQSCTSEFIHQGGSGGFGNVYEPSGSLPFEDVWMPAYARGYTWAEAAYMSLPYMNWMQIVLGDPLMTINSNPFYGVPYAPTNVSATAGNSSAVVSFTSATSSPAITGYVVTSTPGNVTVTGTTSPIIVTGLTPGTSYTFNIVSQSVGGTSTIATSSAVVPYTYATVTSPNNQISNFPMFITLTGYVAATGFSIPTIEGFNYGTTTTYGLVASTSNTLNTGYFNQTITGLTCGTTYHAQAFAVNGAGMGTSGDITFTAPCAIIPSVLTSSSTSITQTSAVLNASIIASGTTTPTAEGFFWGTTTGYGTVSSVSGNFGNGPFSINLPSLSCATTYHYAGYAVNSAGTSTMMDSSFTTSACPAAPTFYSSGGGGGGSVYVPPAIIAASSTISQSSIASTTEATATTTTTSTTSPSSIECPTPYVCVPSSSNFTLTQNLSPGSTGTEVTALQSLLASLGYFSETPTGYYGPVTEAAVKAYQIANGISPLGIVGPQTRAMLNEESNATITNDTSSVIPQSTVTLSVGSISPTVKLLQIYLNTHGYPLASSGPGSPGNETDKFGFLTKASLEAFQSAHGLPVTGEYDQITGDFVRGS